jgi:hypothetical protein
MTSFLCKSKATILDLLKSMPDAHITEEEHFVVWGRQFVNAAVSQIEIGGMDTADQVLSWGTFYAMSYRLEYTEDDAEVKKVVNEAQEYYDVQDKREWVEWVGKTLIPHLHVQTAMEKADMVRAEQEIMDKLQLQEERVKREEEWAAKEVELDEKEAEYIRQVDTKEIKSWTWRGQWGRVLWRGQPRHRP